MEEILVYWKSLKSNTTGLLDLKISANQNQNLKTFHLPTV
jgi:hypothetical protein